MTTQMVPSKGELENYLGQRLTQQQIVEAWERDAGVRVSRSSIAMAIDRYGLRSTNTRPRYEETLPWTVRDEHSHANDARMLRLEGRRRSGGTLSTKEKRLLTNWKQLLEESNAVVLYDPQTEKGFWWIPREPRDGDDLIRRP